MRKKENVSFFPFPLGFVARVLDEKAIVKQNKKGKEKQIAKQKNKRKILAKKKVKDKRNNNKKPKQAN